MQLAHLKLHFTHDLEDFELTVTQFHLGKNLRRTRYTTDTVSNDAL